MAADETRHVTWMGLEVSNRELYVRYRAAIAPILEEYGGRFEHDFEVARVLRSSAGDRINRVFAISFPSLAARGRFFADARYRRIRSELFEPAVAQRATLGGADARPTPVAPAGGSTGVRAHL